MLRALQGLTICAGAYLAAVISCGGLSFTLGPWTVSSERIANPSYAYLLLLFVLAWCVRKTPPPDAAAQEALCCEKRSWRTLLLAWILLVVPLALLTWGRSIEGGFIREDYQHVRWVRDGAPFNGEPRFEPAWGTRFARFFPLMLSSFNWHTAGLNPVPWHLTTLTLHCLVALLCGAFTLVIFGSTGQAVLACTLFAIHPLAVEVACWIVTRDGILVAICTLASVLLLIGAIRRRSSAMHLGSVSVFGISMFCKESGLCVPAGIPLIAWLAEPEAGIWAAIRRSIPHWGALCLYVVFQNAMGAQWHPGGMWSVAKLLLLPMAAAGPLAFPVNVVAIGDLASVARVVAAATLCLLMPLCLLHWRCLTDRRVVAVFGWMLVLALPVHSMIQFSATMQCGRYLYLANTAFCALVAHLIFTTCRAAFPGAASGRRIVCVSLLVAGVYFGLARVNAESWVAAGAFSRRLASDLSALVVPLREGKTVRVRGLPEQYRGAYILYCISISWPLDAHYNLTQTQLSRLVEPYHPDWRVPPVEAGEVEFVWTIDRGFVRVR
ncbi:MAG: hypothetical protein HY815_20040 [Candidatus Riflebacteria bacterium]|nr:hypothetical protein [Candidatus Riflebacteria bacterium]